MNTFEDYKKARIGGKYIKLVKLPNSEVTIGLKLLTVGELLKAEANKNEYLKLEKLENSPQAILLENNIQVLYRSAICKDTEDKFFANTDEVRQLRAEDLSLLVEAYENLSNEVNPLSKELTESDIEDIKKKLENGEIPTELNYIQLLQALMVLGGYKSNMKSEVELSSVNQSNT